MQFETGRIYHIYNQGNNRRKVFFNRENYLFFLKKIKKYITPYADVLAWCLMPNHFHLMIFINELELSIDENGSTHRMTSSHPMSKTRTLNQAIAIVLRSYTRAINKKSGLTGSLFRPKTKAECLNRIDGITPSFVISEGTTFIINQDPEKQYPQACFNYIHNNPVKAGLVNECVDWEFSSAMDYFGKRNGTLINRALCEEYLT